MGNEEHIEYIIPIIQYNCACSGGCKVYGKGPFTVTMGDDELCFFTQEEGLDPKVIREKLKKLTQ